MRTSTVRTCAGPIFRRRTSKVPRSWTPTCGVPISAWRSLFGASLGTVSSDGTIERPARFDATTRWNLDTLSALTDEQLHFLRQRGVG